MGPNQTVKFKAAGRYQSADMRTIIEVGEDLTAVITGDDAKYLAKHIESVEDVDFSDDDEAKKAETADEPTAKRGRRGKS